MKELEFLGQLTKQIALPPEEPWWLQSSRVMEQSATTDGSENKSAFARSLSGLADRSEGKVV